MANASPSEQQIEDPEEISQKQRIKEILDRRRQTLQSRDEAKMAALMGEANERDALLFYRSQLESLIYELWNAFHNIGSGDAGEYIDTKTIGHITIHPPERLLESVNEWDSGVERPEPKQYEIQGLKWYIEQPNEISAEFSIRSFDPPAQITEPVERVLHWQELDRGLQACFEFMHQAGIDADLAAINKEGEAKYEWIAEKIENE